MTEILDTSAPQKRSIAPAMLGITLGLLLGLALLSYILSFQELGRFSIPIAMLIAIAKGSLVALFFMELLIEKFTIRVTLATGITLMLILIGLMLADISTRSIPPIASPTTPGRTRY